MDQVRWSKDVVDAQVIVEGIKRCLQDGHKWVNLYEKDNCIYVQFLGWSLKLCPDGTYRIEDTCGG